jgi:hypothetical protein
MRRAGDDLTKWPGNVAAAKARNLFSVQAKSAAGVMISSDVKKTVLAEQNQIWQNEAKKLNIFKAT